MTQREFLDGSYVPPPREKKKKRTFWKDAENDSNRRQNNNLMFLKGEKLFSHVDEKMSKFG